MAGGMKPSADAGPAAPDRDAFSIVQQPLVVFGFPSSRALNAAVVTLAAAALSWASGGSVSIGHSVSPSASRG
jgi:hypothetical protein